MLNSYYDNNRDTFLLYEALQGFNKSVNCEKTRGAAIEGKISVLNLMGKYLEGYKFIDSLNVADFRFPYKKQVHSDYFLAQNFLSEGDTTKYKFYINKIIDNINDHIQKKLINSDKISEEPFYDLYYMKSKILNKNEFLTEVEKLKNKYPQEKDFFDNLYETFYNLKKVINPDNSVK